MPWLHLYDFPLCVHYLGNDSEFTTIVYSVSEIHRMPPEYEYEFVSFPAQNTDSRYFSECLDWSRCEEGHLSMNLTSNAKSIIHKLRDL